MNSQLSDKKNVEQNVEEYFDDILQQRIEINKQLHKAGFFPRAFIKKEREVNPALKGDSKE